MLRRSTVFGSILVLAACTIGDDSEESDILSSQEFADADEVIVSADIADEAVNHADFTEDDNPVIASIVMKDGGFVDFVDESQISGPGEVGIIAVGSAVALIEPHQQELYISPLELYSSLSTDPAPALLVENHLLLASRGLVPSEPRELMGWRNETIDFTCQNQVGPEAWHSWFNTWRMGYGVIQGIGNHFGQNFYITTPSRTQRALAACHTQGAVVPWIEITMNVQYQLLSGSWAIFYTKNFPALTYYAAVAHRSTSGTSRAYRLGVFHIPSNYPTYWNVAASW